MMAANDGMRTGAPGAARPELWLACPASAGTAARVPQAERELRAALFGSLAASGREPVRGPGVSHARGAVAVYTGPQGRVGIDLEVLRPRDSLSMASFAFHAAEAAWLAQRSPATRDADFVHLWVLKEAAGKVLGLDLFGALAQCRFEVDAGRVTGQLPGSVPWRAVLYAPRPAYRLAVLALGADSAPEAAACHEWATGRATAAAWPVLARGGSADQSLAASPSDSLAAAPRQ